MSTDDHLTMQSPDAGFEEAFGKTVELGNRIAENESKPDMWEVADGLLAGALQFWLYSRQPCGDLHCEDCEPISTAQGRMAELHQLIEQFATESEYFHSPQDSNVGRA